MRTMEIHRRVTRSSHTDNANDSKKSNTNVNPAKSGGDSGGGRVSVSGPPSKAFCFRFRSFNASVSVVAAVVFYALFMISAPYIDITSSNQDNGSRASGNLRRSSTTSFHPLQNQTIVRPEDLSAIREQLSQLRQEFYHRYGGKDNATQMLQRGLRTFEQINNDKFDNNNNNEHKNSIRATANRFLSAIVRHEAASKSRSPQPQQPNFVMAFAGYSVTVGRGNHLEQSYPLVLEKILSPVLKLPPLNIKLTVRNAAIGGIPSFPYGWCLRNFLGDDADLVSWDYGMNEGNGASGLESYVRQSLTLPKSPPLFVLLDVKSRSRLDILQRYVNLGVLPDPIALGGKDAVDSKLLALSEKERPVGLQGWEEWGAPKGAPGQSPWHAKKMEHELMAWMLAMRMIDALDAALSVMENDAHWRIPILALLEDQQKQESAEVVILPPPVTDVSKTGVPSLLHGIESTTNEWHLGRISCRTSFLPTISGDLNSIVESGVMMDDTDMLQPRNDALFNGGWVMDVGKLERDTKLKVQTYGGLGYIDMKTALYGIPSSGALRFWLPYEGSSTPTDNASVSDYFNAIVVCEVNEKRGDKECNMISDLEFRVGDEVVPRGNILRVKDVASYLKKDICIRVIPPTEAKLSSKKGSSNLGLALEVSVSGNSVTRENGACSISHVIWENKVVAD